MRIYSGESARVLPHGQLCRRRRGARAPPSAFPRYGRGAEATSDASPRVASARRDHRVDAEDERTQTAEEVSEYAHICNVPGCSQDHIIILIILPTILITMPTCQMGQQQFSMPLRHLNLDFSFRTVLEKKHPEVSFANKTQIVAKRNNRPNIIF